MSAENRKFLFGNAVRQIAFGNFFAVNGPFSDVIIHRIFFGFGNVAVARRLNVFDNKFFVRAFRDIYSEAFDNVVFNALRGFTVFGIRKVEFHYNVTFRVGFAHRPALRGKPAIQGVFLTVIGAFSTRSVQSISPEKIKVYSEINGFYFHLNAISGVNVYCKSFSVNKRAVISLK